MLSAGDRSEVAFCGGLAAGKANLQAICTETTCLLDGNEANLMSLLATKLGCKLLGPTAGGMK